MPPKLVKCSQMAPGRIVLPQTFHSNVGDAGHEPLHVVLVRGQGPVDDFRADAQFLERRTARGKPPWRTRERMSLFSQ